MGGILVEASKIAEYARSLYDAHGDKAELEAAQKARECRESGKATEAETWDAVRKAVSQIRGAHES